MSRVRLLVMLVAFVALHDQQVVEGRTRTYYIAAVEDDWDYAPQGNLVNEDTVTSDVFLKKTADRIGSVYLKAMYREFTDATFTVRAQRPPYLGFLGPIIRAEEDDTIRIVFKNLAFLSGKNFSMHPHGVQYSKNTEGALYVDNTTGTDKADDGVPPGREFTYVWRVSPSFAPTSDDDPCLPWAYHSHTSPIKDVDTGLVGLMTTCKKGTLVGRDGNKRKDVDAEYPLYVEATDEGNSWLRPRNLNKCGSPAACVALDASQNSAFVASNMKRHVNGRMYGNLAGLTAGVRQKSVFYFFNLDREIHSVHFNGQVLTVRGQRMDSVQVFPATFVAAYMTPVFTGHWLMASTVTESFSGGQLAYLEVTDSNRHKRQSASINQAASETEARAVAPGFASFAGQDANRLHNRIVQENPSLAVPEEGALSDGRLAFKPVAPPAAWQGRPWWSKGIGSGNGGRPNRQFYLGIEDYEWNYGPSGEDLYNGGSLTAPGSNAATYFIRGANRIGGKYRKSRYVQFTDSGFGTRMSRDASDKHLGMLGPVLKMEVGETVTVTVRNMAGRPYSFFPNGLIFSKDQEGFVYKNPNTNTMEGTVVAPGETTSYTFVVPALGENDNPCIVSTYQSAVDPLRDVNTGLFGPLLMCQRGQLVDTTNNDIRQGPPTGSWYEQNKHFYLNFLTVDENLSWHLQYNIDTYTTSPATVNLNDAGFIGANRKHAINGRMFGNLMGLNVCRGEKVAWHLFGAGDRLNVHGANFHGQALDLSGNHINAKVLIPGTALTLTSSPDVVGQWAIVCRTNFHLLTGMAAKYQTINCPGLNKPPVLSSRVVRNFYLAAEEVYHDYAPLKRDLITGHNFTSETQSGYIFVRDDYGYIGSVYKKARYIRYTDASFSTLFPQGTEDEHLGVMGPVLAAEVGDVIRVTFRNKASRPYSIHPQGVQCNKTHEGAKYEDGSAATIGDRVMPGNTFVYEWSVPPSAGPGPSDPSCVPWMYYSSVDSVKDTLSGLMGPLLICRSGILVQGPNGKLRRKDVDREFWMMYFVMDENGSWYIDSNVAQFAPERLQLGIDNNFTTSNVMFSINGKIYGNVRGMVMNEGDVVAWHLLGLGSSFDYHPVHFHGQTFIHKIAYKEHRGDVLEVFPSTSSTVTMLCDNPGEWIVHCHFGTHAISGMEATYTIQAQRANGR